MNQKRRIITLLLTGLMWIGQASVAEQSHHDHDHGHGDAHVEIKAPNGGRIVKAVEPHFEFYLNSERSVEIRFLDTNGNVIAPAEQHVSLIGGDRTNAVRVGFERVDDYLRSTESLPELPGMPIVLQIRNDPDAEPVREKFYLKTYTCSECQLAEYACSCGHG